MTIWITPAADHAGLAASKSRQAAAQRAPKRRCFAAAWRVVGGMV